MDFEFSFPLEVYLTAKKIHDESETFKALLKEESDEDE